MKKILLIPFFIFFLAGISEAHEAAFKFINANVFNGIGFDKKDFYSVNGNISFSYAGKIDSTIDLQNLYVIPPFADAHNHIIADGMDYMEQINTCLSQGIFYVKNPNNTIKLTEPIKKFVNIPESVDIIYSNGGLTAAGGHPVQIYKFIAERGIFPGWAEQDMENQAYYIINNEADLNNKWGLIKSGSPDFIKVYLEHSEEYEKRKDDPAFYGQKGLNPQLLPVIVKKAHNDNYKVSAHVSTSADFHNAVIAGVDEINHLPLALIDAKDAELAAEKGITVVTTVLSHRPAGDIKNINEIHAANIKLLVSKGVKLAVGVDNGDVTALNEIESIRKMNIFDNLSLLKLWAEATTSAIFPGKKLGKLTDGYEANFLVLGGSPIEDFKHVKDIRVRVKRGHFINIKREERKPSIVDAIGHTLMRDGVAAAIEEYKKLKAAEADSYDFSEQQLNGLGYELIKRKMLNEAIEIFKLNAEVFPASPNVYDSLGEAYMHAGNKELAIKNYEKALQLNPHNEGAVKMLAKLKGE